jgi:Flp pilus assembly protein TadG
MGMPRARLAGSRRERGSIAPSIPIIAMLLLILGGLVVDASRQLNGRGQAVAFAEEAARAGAQAVDLAPDTDGDGRVDDELVLDQAMAQSRVERYCRVVEAQGAVDQCSFVRIEAVGAGDPRPLVVVTRVRMSVPTTLLGMVGVTTLTASAEGKARPYEGTTRDDTR